MENRYAIQLNNITKSFPGVKALDGVSFNVKWGAVHSIVGENGAGKSTLMKIINGMLPADSGEIFIDGKKVNITNPQKARDLGIAMIFQELNYVPNLTVAENFFINKQPRNKLKMVDWKEMKTQARKILSEEGVTDITEEYIMADVPISDIQMLEIVKATRENARIIIMDEPTSSLTQGETKRLFQKIEELKERGCAILYISHKMDEVFNLSDDITIMRDGKTIKTASADSFDASSVVSMMVGRPIDNIYPSKSKTGTKVVLDVRNLSGKKFRDISFCVKEGEIVGLAGLVGAGRTEIVTALFGLDACKSGEVYLNGKSFKPGNISNAIKSGIVMATEDRRKYGLVSTRSIKENISLPYLKEFFSTAGFLKLKEEKHRTKLLFERLRIKALGLNTTVGTLSGGNQQKVVLAKWLLKTPKVLIMDEPTRGIDVGAKHEIYEVMTELAKEGVAIVMISSELPEMIGMCNRVYVIGDGQIKGELSEDEMTQEMIMGYATGGH